MVYQQHLFIHSMLAMAFKGNPTPRNYASAAMPPKRDAKEVPASDMRSGRGTVLFIFPYSLHFSS